MGNKVKGVSVKESIPPEIMKEIKERMILRMHNRNATHWFSYFEYQKGRLSISTVAARVSNKYKNKKTPTIFAKKCIVRVLDAGQKALVYVRDAEFTMIAGYKATFVSARKSDTRRKKIIINVYDESGWWQSSEHYFRLYYWNDFLNMDFLQNTEYRYCAFDWKSDLQDYLFAYKENPRIELITKLVSSKYAVNKNIVSRATKDKQFIVFLKNNAAEIKRLHASANAVIQAYRDNKPIEDVVRAEEVRKSLTTECGANDTTRAIYAAIKSLGEKTVLEYANYTSRVGRGSYEDYFRCIRYLGLDLTDKKNLFPHDFKRWHDVRVDEYHSKRAAEDKEKRKELCDKFALIAEKYRNLSWQNVGGFAVLIAGVPEDLVREGDILHHCVGRMGYDQKFIREESLIFFVRTMADLNTPFVTVEYDLKGKKVKQCYGDHDSRPAQNVLDFVYNVWQPRATKELSKLSKAS